MTQALDFPADPKSLAALSLAPLVAVAWAEAGMDDEERKLMLSWAAEIGLTKSDSAYELLEDWLAKRPGPQLLELWKSRYVNTLSRSLSREAKEELKRHLLHRARALVQATGSFSGVAQTSSTREQTVIDEIESAFP
jgi:hypothetical protein